MWFINFNVELVGFFINFFSFLFVNNFFLGYLVLVMLLV